MNNTINADEIPYIDLRTGMTVLINAQAREISGYYMTSDSTYRITYYNNTYSEHMLYTTVSTEWTLFTEMQARKFGPDVIARRTEWVNYGHHYYDGMISARSMANDTSYDSF